LTPAAEGYSAARGKISESEKESRKELAARRLAAIQGGYGIYSDAEKNKLQKEQIKATTANANNPTDRGNYIKDYVNAARAGGDTRPEAQIRMDGQKQYTLDQATVYNTATKTGQDINELNQATIDGVMKEVEAMTADLLSPEGIAYKNIPKLANNKPDFAAQEAFKNMLFKRQMRIRGANPGAAPTGVPQTAEETAKLDKYGIGAG
jgi:hypothetical protein